MSNKSEMDVWHTKYYSSAIYTGSYEMPVLRGTTDVPKSVIRFSDSKTKRDNKSSWVVPYEFDYKIESFWNNADRYLPNLLRHPGIISWDFSMYRNMPFSLQYWNCFRGRLLGSYFEANGGTCIPNLRPTDSRSFSYCFEGIPEETTVAMSTAGNMRDTEDIEVYRRFVDETVRRLHPSCIVVYGLAPDKVFEAAIVAGTKIVPFQTNFSLAHATVTEAKLWAEEKGRDLILDLPLDPESYQFGWIHRYPRIVS